MLRSKIHYQKGFNMILFSYKMVAGPPSGVSKTPCKTTTDKSVWGIWNFKGNSEKRVSFFRYPTQRTTNVSRPRMSACNVTKSVP